MAPLVIQPTITAQWQTLIQEAENNSQLTLSEELESYLVFLLVRFTEKPELAASVLALEFFHGAQALGLEKQEQLREVGDKCLLFAGLFPGRAERRRVRISYYVQLGKSAYSTLAVATKNSIAELYAHLGQCFVALMDVLHAIRELAQGTHSLTPLQAEEVWRDTNSPHALAVLRRYTQAIPVLTNHYELKH